MYRYAFVFLIIAAFLLHSCSATKEVVSKKDDSELTDDTVLTQPSPDDPFGDENGTITEEQETKEDAEKTESGELSEEIDMEAALRELQALLQNPMLREETRPYRAANRKVNDLVDTKLEVRFDWDKQHLLGKATLQLEPYFYPTDEAVLEAKGFDIHEVAMVTGSSKKPLEFTYDSMQITIKLGKEYKKGERYTLFIDYTAKPNELEEKNPVITYDNKGLYFINPKGEDPTRPMQIWTQGETEASSCWYPTIDHPNERTSQEMYVTVKDKYVSLTNGKFLGSTKNSDGTRTDHWKQELAHAPYLFALIVGEYAVVKDKWKDIEVNYYVEPEYEPYARDIFGNTPEMLEFFSKKLDYEYPWDKYSQIVIRDFTSGAMENTGAVTFFEDLHRNKRELLDLDHEDIIAHELFHHWFGDLVTCESWANLPLNEAFATYGEYLWFEHKYGRNKADHHLNKDLDMYLSEAASKQVPIFRFHYNNPDDLFDRHSYQKGGRVLHMLRKYVGDDAFFESLQLYLKNHDFEAVEVHDLRQAFEEVTGEDLNWFFDQWFLNAGHPYLDISYDYDSKLQQAIVKIEQRQTRKAFELPLYIDIYHEDGTKERKETRLIERFTTLTFDAPKEPKLINVDAEKMLLCEKDDAKSLEQFVYQYENAPLFLDKYESIIAFDEEQETSDVATNMLIKAINNDFWVLRQEAVNRIKLEQVGVVKEAKPLLVKLAEGDKKSLVRAAAVERLSELKDKELAQLFEKKLGDESYAVSAAAIRGLYEINPERALEVAKNVENEENISIMEMVAKIYSETGGAEKQAYFEKRLQNQSYDRYTMIDHYKVYLKRSDEPIIEKGIPILNDIARTDRNWWVRLNATQAISEILGNYNEQKKALEKNGDADDEKMKKISNRITSLTTILQDIKSKETDEKLLYYYENM